VRVLFTFVGGAGHFDPLVPVARAMDAAGHTVAFSAHPLMVPIVELWGFTAYATAPDDRPPPARRPLREVSLERELRDMREKFAGHHARVRAAGILALCADWRPDLLVRDETDFGCTVAAERLGVPCATVLITAFGTLVRPEVVGEPLDALRAEHGLPPDPQLAALDGDLVISPFPPGFREPDSPLPASARSMRLVDVGRGCEDGAVYFTLGTVFNLESGDLFTRVLEGLRGLDVIATVGPQIDPAELGDQPENIRVERYIPQAEVLPRCRAMVSHGGSGAILGALAHGLPMVLIPMGADQPLNAARAAELELARVLDSVRATPADVSAAVADVLERPGYRRAAERMRDELEALPGVEHAVGLLEDLAVR
jgi:UDP:flavonoid glycosyltransferase YjiC (YdhE family)